MSFKKSIVEFLEIIETFQNDMGTDFCQSFDDLSLINSD